MLNNTKFIPSIINIPPQLLGLLKTNLSSKTKLTKLTNTDVIPYPNIVPIYTFKLVESNQTISKFTISDPERIGESASNLSEKIDEWNFGIEPKDYYKTRHEVVSKCFGNMETDFKLGALYKMHDGSDEMTPDYIIWDDESKTYVVVELATVTFMSDLEETYSKKLNKYFDQVQRRIDKINELILTNKTALMDPNNNNNNDSPLMSKNITIDEILDENRRKFIYYVVVVGPDGVLSNLDFPDEWLISFKTHYQIGTQCVTVLKDLYPEFFIDANDLEWLKEFKNKTSKITLPEEDPTEYLITEEMISKWKDIQPTPDMYHRFMREIGTEALKKMRKKKNESLDDVINLANEYYQKWDDLEDSFPSGLRADQKAIMPIGMFRFKADYVEYSDLDSVNYLYNVLSSYEQTTMIKIWKQALSQRSGQIRYGEMTSDHQITTKEMELMEKVVERQSKEQISQENKDKIKKFRISLSISTDEWKEISLTGLKGSLYSDEALNKAHKERSKVPFSRNVKTDDIERFIQNDFKYLMHHEAGGFYYSPAHANALDLIEFARANLPKTKATELCHGFVDAFTKTKMSSMLQIFSMIIEELNYGLSQFSYSNEFVLKRVRDLPLWILARTSGPDKNICFSILAGKELKSMNLPFKVPLIENEDFTMFEFVTINRHKISHYLYAPWRMCAVFASMFQVFEVDPTDFCEFKAWDQMDSMYRHLAALILIYLEDRPETSNVLILLRYAYMEITTGSPFQKNPLKVLTKFPERVRGRLTVYFINKIINFFSEQLNLNPKLHKPDIKKVLDKSTKALNKVAIDELEGAKSFLDKTTLPNYGCVLFLSYMSHLHNKEERDVFQSYLRIFNKIIREELALRNCDKKHRFFGRETQSLHKYVDHEFDPEWAVSASVSLCRVLEDKLGIKWKQQLEDEIYTMLMKSKTEDLATFKSSSVPPKKDHIDVDFDSLRRRKCSEAIIEAIYMGFVDEKPFSEILLVIEQIEKQHGVTAQLFEKDQHGGSREIFILDIYSRIAIHLVEKISRTICNHLPSEMLTKGDQKIQKSNMHYNKVFAATKTMKSEHSLTVIDSDDASTWCQRFTMRIMFVTISRVLPDSLVRLVAKILNFVTTKKLFLPDELLMKFSEHIETLSIDEGMKEMKYQFLDKLGISEHDLIDYYGRFLKNLSNFMQGILHYTSSVCHCAHQSLVNFINLLYFENAKRLQLLPTNAKLWQSNKISSDDSSTLRTITDANIPDHNWVTFLCFTSFVKGVAYTYLSIKRSEEKSTIMGFTGIEEFNSMWFVNNTLVMPILKYVFVSTTVPVIENIQGRLQLYSNYLSQCIEAGVTFFTTGVLQYVLAFIHYTGLGCNTNKFFPLYKELLFKKPSPIFGFYVFQPEQIGLFGHDFAYYYFCSKNNQCKRILQTLMSTPQGIEINEWGKPQVNFELLIGSRKKYYEFLDRVRFIMPNWREHFNEHPELLFQKSKNVLDCVAKIRRVQETPSSADAFSMRTANKLHATSVYILQTPCIACYFYSDDETSKYKMSLIKLMREIELSDVMSDSNFSLMFPMSKIYDNIISKLPSGTDHFLEKKKYRLPCHLIIHHLPKTEINVSVTLGRTLLAKWFDQKKVHGSVTEINLAFVEYQRMFNWIKGGYKETINHPDFPFKDILSMGNFVMGFVPQKRSIRVLAPVRKGLPITVSIDNLIKTNFFPGYTLKEENVKERSTKWDNINTVSNFYMMMGSCPNDKNLIKGAIENFTKKVGHLLNVENEDTFMSTLKMNSPNDVLTLAIHETILGSGDMVARNLFEIKRGVFGTFTTPQIKKVNSKTQEITYKGTGIYLLKIDDDIFRFHLYDDFIYQIDATSVFSLRTNYKLIKRHLMESNLSRLKTEFIEKVSHDMENYYNLEFGHFSEIWRTGFTPLRLISKIEDQTQNLRLEWGLNEKNIPRLTSPGPTGSHYTVLTAKPNPWHFSELLYKENIKRIPFHGSATIYVDTWLEWGSLEVTNKGLGANLEGTVNDIKRRLRNPHDELAKKEKIWLKTTLLIKASVISSVPMINVKLITNDSDVKDDVEAQKMLEKIEKLPDFESDFDINAIKEMYETNKKLYAKRPELKTADEIIEDMQEISNSFIDEMTNSLRKVDFTSEVFKGYEAPSKYNIAALHPFWDIIFKELKKRHHNYLQLILSQYKVDFSGSQIGQAISWIIDNDSKPIKEMEDEEFRFDNND